MSLGTSSTVTFGFRGAFGFLGLGVEEGGGDREEEEAVGVDADDSSVVSGWDE